MRLTKYPYYLRSALRLLVGVAPLARVVALFVFRTPRQAQLFRLRGSGVTFKARSAMDLWSVKETFFDRFYEKFGFALQPGWIVIDIGGGIGEYTLFAALAHPQNCVLAFEPTPDSFALLQENLELNSVRNAQVFQKAIWSEDGEVVINTHPGEPSQFTSENQIGRSTSDHGIRATATSLAHALHNLGVTQVDLLKLDCEGAEYAILFNTPGETLSTIQRIVMETHDAPATSKHHDLVAFLQAHGYTVETFPNFVHPHLGYLRAWRGPLARPVSA